MSALSMPVLLITILQVEVQGWSHQSHYLGRKLGELRRIPESYNVMLPSEMESSASAEHLKKAIEEIVNRTRGNGGQAVRGIQHASLPRFSGTGYQATDSGIQKPTSSVDLMSPTDTPLKNAKKFWNHFMFRRRSDFQSIIPIRNNEVHQEKCRAVPFFQSVAHENCETVVLRNNLCFGRCNSVHVPNSDDGPQTFCSYCSHVKSTRRAVQLKCAGDTHITKVVTMVEECRCEMQRGRHSHHHSGPALIDPSLLGNLS
nr:cerberus-like [Paramormyrops kingsleyae]